MITIDKDGVYTYTIKPDVYAVIPVPQIRNARFRADSLKSLGDWIIKQDFGALSGWVVDGIKEDAHGEFAKEWEGSITLRSPTGNRFRFDIGIQWVVQPVPKTYDEMTMEEKAVAIAKSLQSHGIKL